MTLFATIHTPLRTHARTPARAHARTFYSGALLLTLAGCATAPARLDAPAQAEILAPGAISLGTQNSAYLGSFTPDGREFYFFRKVPGDARTESYRIFVSRLENGVWTVADTLRLGESPSDLYPAIDASGEYLVFSSYRRAPGDTSAHPSASIWQARRSGNGWSAPVAVTALTSHGNYHSGLQFDRQNRLRFGRQTGDYRTRLGDFAAPFANGTFSAPERVEFTEQFRALAAPLRLYQAIPCPEANCALLTAAPVDSAGRAGPGDFYVTFNDGGNWTSPRPLGAGVNTPEFENFPMFTPDGATFVFVRGFHDFVHVSWRAATGR